jgi:DtxR family transcriptional regulator, Mn-dependent transcriptional regulator
VHTSPAAQDYLKAIYALESSDDDPREGAVPNMAIAQRLGVSPASATNMLKKLDHMGLITYAPYKGAWLTQAGRETALEVVRHHRLLETYLSEALGVPWDAVHAEAEVLEHVLSEDLEERIAALLGDPAADPHGHPIPARDLSMPGASTRPLWDTRDGDRIAVERASDRDAGVLRYLAAIGIKPGTTLEVVGRGPRGGPLFVRLAARADEVLALSKELAEAVSVTEPME